MAKKNLLNTFDAPKSNVQFSEGQKSKGILDDYAIRGVINTKEGTIEHVPTATNDILNKSYGDATYSAAGHTHTHLATTGRTANDHHNEVHTHTHASTTGQTVDDHHNEEHNINTHVMGDNKIIHTKAAGAITEISLGAAGSFLTSGGAAADMTFTAEGDIDHDGLTNWSANKHIDWTSTASNLVTTGTGKTGNFECNELSTLSDVNFKDQNVYGSAASGGDLTFDSTTHATKGNIIMADSNLLVGGPSSTISTTNYKFQVLNDGGFCGFNVFTGSSVDWQHDSRIYFRRSRNTNASPTAVIDNDAAGRFSFMAHDGTGYKGSVQIRAFVDGTVSTGVVPMELRFLTGSDHASNLFTRMTLKPDGRILIADGNTMLQLSKLTTTQRNVFTASEGMICYNTTTTTVDCYINGAWHTLDYT